MDVRQRTEEIERLTLAPWATFSDASRGRVRPEEQDPIRPVFQRDRDRIIHCKAFRRLKQKTQVFLSPEGDLYRIPPSWTMLWVIPYLLLLFLLTFGFSCFLLHCGVFFEDLANIVRVGLRLLFYMSGIFYNPEVQLTGVVRYLMIRLNPTCYIITQLRNTVLYGQMPLWHWFIVWGVVGLIVSALGVALIYRYERRYVKTI